MTIKALKEKYVGYTISVEDDAGWFWELGFSGDWYAVGEWGWSVKDAKVSAIEAVGYKVCEAEKVVMVQIAEEL